MATSLLLLVIIHLLLNLNCLKIKPNLTQLDSCIPDSDTSKHNPIILVKLTNDSGILSPGIKSLQNLSNTPKNDGELPNHLKILPPTLEIPKGYKWIFVHGGWTLIPNVNTEKFYLQESSPHNPIDDFIDDEQLDWGEDEDFPRKK